MTKVREGWAHHQLEKVTSKLWKSIIRANMKIHPDNGKSRLGLRAPANMQHLKYPCLLVVVEQRLMVDG